MYTITGSCPNCGAPYYTPTVWHGILPPQATPSCSCRENAARGKLVPFSSRPQTPEFLKDESTARSLKELTDTVQKLTEELSASRSVEKPLTSLTDFNSETRALYEKFSSKRNTPNGIACPCCGVELVDVDVTNVSHDSKGYPTTQVLCQKCGFNGKRLLGLR